MPTWFDPQMESKCGFITTEHMRISLMNDGWDWLFQLVNPIKPNDTPGNPSFFQMFYHLNWLPTGKKYLASLAGSRLGWSEHEVNFTGYLRLNIPMIHHVFTSLWLKPQVSCGFSLGNWGQTRNEVGPQLLQVGPYEELLNVSTKWVLEKEGLTGVNGGSCFMYIVLYRFTGGTMGKSITFLSFWGWLGGLKVLHVEGESMDRNGGNKSSWQEDTQSGLTRTWPIRCYWLTFVALLGIYRKM